MFGLMPWRKEEKARGGYYPVMPLRNEFEALFNRFFGPAWLEPVHDNFWGWNLETEETENEYKVRMELPGFEPPEVEVLVTKERLTVKAEHKKEVKEEKKEEKVEYTEKHYGKFERTITLPEGIEGEKAEAMYRNGILEVRLPKVPEVKPKKVEVKT